MQVPFLSLKNVTNMHGEDYQKRIEFIHQSLIDKGKSGVGCKKWE